MQCDFDLILFWFDGVVREMLKIVLHEHFLGYAYEELSEVSPNHQFLAYTMYDNDNGYFKLSVRNLNSGSLCSKPQADRVSNLAWAKDGQALLYVVREKNETIPVSGTR
jgi:protease II